MIVELLRADKAGVLQWTGINTVIFYAPQLFISLGTGRKAALLATIVTGVVNHFATYVSLWAADSFGRRILFLEGGVQMLLALVRLPFAHSLAGSPVMRQPITVRAP